MAQNPSKLVRRLIPAALAAILLAVPALAAAAPPAPPATTDAAPAARLHSPLTPGERAFLWDRGLQASTQGMTVFTAGGTVLATGGGFEPRGVEKMLRKALAAYRPDADPAFDVAAEERAADLTADFGELSRAG